jgi:hypothetical protein
MVDYFIWCEDCRDWVDDFKEKGSKYVLPNTNTLWLCCASCGLGLIKVVNK